MDLTCANFKAIQFPSGLHRGTLSWQSFAFGRHCFICDVPVEPLKSFLATRRCFQIVCACNLFVSACVSLYVSVRACVRVCVCARACGSMHVVVCFRSAVCLRGTCVFEVHPAMFCRATWCCPHRAGVSVEKRLRKVQRCRHRTSFPTSSHAAGGQRHVITVCVPR